jgi:tetratricopeptide (TPR) repeat protein
MKTHGGCIYQGSNLSPSLYRSPVNGHMTEEGGKAMNNVSAHDNIDNVYRDPLDSFTDREQMVTLFEQFLASVQPGKTRFLAVKGNSGTGKTFLIEYLSQRVCPSRGWQTGQLTFAQAIPDFRSILKDLEDALKGCVPSESLKQYRTNRDAYNKSFDDYRNAVTINQAVEVKENSIALNITQSTQIIIRLRERERQLRSELTHALLELAEECQRPLCLFIDGYERLVELDRELVGWLWEAVLLKLATSSPQPFLVMTCGWEWPVNTAIKTVMQREALDDFDLMRVRHYLYKQGVLSPDAASTEQEELIIAFHDLSKGHPLVLSLAVTYFHELNAQERTAASLRTKQSLIDDKARIEFLDERLLSHLPEPHRTLLERGPILRSLDQRTLQELLQLGFKDAKSENKLDDRTYEHFLHYPFINIQTVSGDSLLVEPTFHELVRRVRLDTLRRLHPETKKQLHRRMADYYERIIGAERKQELIYLAGTVNAYTRSKYIERLVEIPEKEFLALLEYFYHALQVEELRVNALEDWQVLTRSMLHSWRREQTKSLLEVVRQLREEGESFLSKTSSSYGHYLILYARFLEQQAHWNEARTALEEAAHLFEQLDNLFDSARCLNNIGHLCNSQGKLEEALGYYERALVLLVLQSHLERKCGRMLQGGEAHGHHRRDRASQQPRRAGVEHH